MDIMLFIQAAVSFLVGGLFIAGTTMLSERIGTKRGGLIAGTPSTVLVSLFFQGWAVSADHAAQAASSALLVTGIFGIFVSVFVYLAPVRGFWTGLIGAFVVWALCIGPILMADVNEIYMTVPLFVGVATVSLWALWFKKIEHCEASKSRHPWYSVMTRSLFGGSVIAASVVIGALIGETAGGVFSAFPATGTSTFLLLYYSSGLNFTLAVAKGIVLGAYCTVSVYLIAVYFFYPLWGIGWGTLAAYLLSMGAAYILVRARR